MRAWCVRAAAGLLIIAAILLAGHRHPWLTEDWLPGSGLPALDRAVLAVTLLVLAHGLAGRRRLALRVTFALAVFAILPPVRAEALAAPAILALLLLPGRASFAVRPDPQRLRTAFYAASGALAVVLGRIVWETARHGETLGTDRSARVFVAVVSSTAVVALAIALAPSPAPPPSGEDDRARVRLLVQDPESGSLAPFVSRADRTYVFSDRGDAAIGYRVRFGVALAGGDPVGHAPAAAIGAFCDLCAEHGWRPAVLGADAAATGELWRRAGVRRAVEIGDEAVLDVPEFSLASRRLRNVRQAARRAGNAGVRVRVGPLEPALVPALGEVLRDWLHGRGERGFAMNLDAILTPRSGVLFAVAVDQDGTPVAFARFAIAAGGRILTLDVAPRRRDAPNGVVERMIVAVVDHARAQGAAEVTLNFAGMRRIYAGTTRLARLARVPLHALDRWIELRSLYRFTEKFRPRWRARQLRMRSWWEIGPVAAAALTAEFGGRATAEPVPVEWAEVPAT